MQQHAKVGAPRAANAPGEPAARSPAASSGAPLHRTRPAEQQRQEAEQAHPAVGSAIIVAIGVPVASADRSLSPPALLACTRTVYSVPLASTSKSGLDRPGNARQ